MTNALEDKAPRKLEYADPEDLDLEEQRVWEMCFRSEVLSLAFGMLLILLTYGDAHMSSSVGNLDTIFGIDAWRAHCALE